MNDHIAALLAERYAPPRWWKTPPREEPVDDDVTTAIRRRHMAQDFARHDNYHRKEAS